MEDFLMTFVQKTVSSMQWPFYMMLSATNALVSLVQHEPKIMHQVVLITGASSGLGEALATLYSKKCDMLVLIARDKSKLKAVQQKLKGNRANVFIHACDVTDKNAMKSIISNYPNIDLVIANAGTCQGLLTLDNNKNIIEQTTEELFATNVHGVFNTVYPVLDAMKANKRGQICVISSISGLGSDGIYPIYGASKVAVTAWAEGLRAMLKPYGIKVNIACPGPVKTKLLDAMSISDLLAITPARCADYIYKGLQDDKLHIHCWTPIYCLAWNIFHEPTYAVKKLLLDFEGSILRKPTGYNFMMEYAFKEEIPSTTVPLPLLKQI
ncbi:hypothetical protein WA158_004665 [Blastocystis sp. Blastoise]